jgi:hypothetical protein
MKLISLIKSQNNGMKRLIQISWDFLPAFEKGDFDQLESFQAIRDSILKAIELFDRKITEAVADLPAEYRSEVLKLQVSALLLEREGLFRELEAADAELISLIESEKNRLKKDLGLAEKQKNVIRKFKSQPEGPAGKEMDRKL